MLIEMRLVGLSMDPFNNSPIVVLTDRASNEEASSEPSSTVHAPHRHAPNEAMVTDKTEHVLPIWVTEAEAHSIASVLLNLASPLPTTHDLLCSMMERWGAKLHRSIITDVRENTFYARIECTLQDGEKMTFDARPSDAIALALRWDADVFVASTVLEQTKKNERTPQIEQDSMEQFEEETWKELVENFSADSTKKYTQ